MKKITVVLATGIQAPFDVPDDAEIDFDGVNLTVEAEGSNVGPDKVYVCLGQGGIVVIDDANKRRLEAVQDLPQNNPFGNAPQ